MSHTSLTTRSLLSGGLSLTLLLAILGGCTAALHGDPYGEEDEVNAKNQRTSEATTKGADVPVEADGTTAANGDDGGLGARPAAPADASTGDASSPAATATTTSPPPPPPPPSCTGKKGYACEDCCVALIPGGTNVSKQMDDIYNDCTFSNGCFTSDCFDYCDGVASSQGCAGSNGSICDQIDACISRSACY